MRGSRLLRGVGEDSDEDFVELGDVDAYFLESDEPVPVLLVDEGVVPWDPFGCLAVADEGGGGHQASSEPDGGAVHDVVADGVPGT